MKGSSASLGGLALAELCDQLLTHLEVNHAAAVHLDLMGIRAEYDRLTAALRAQRSLSYEHATSVSAHLAAQA